jgi:TrmH family RNA methyltransferase
MISKTNIRLVKGLQDKKQRQKYNQFVVEGEKSITELLTSNYKILKIFAFKSWIEENIGKMDTSICIEVDEQEMKQISIHLAPPRVLVILEIPNPYVLEINNGFVLALDEIQDPGNLGTIIRIADWYGIKQIICSKGCTDVYAPKCINSTMGSFFRVNVFYGDILEYASQSDLPLLVSTFDGQNIHKGNLPKSGILVIGNEGHGIHPNIIKASNYQVTIPKFGNAESLNAGVSAAVLLDNLIHAAQ